MVDRFDLEEKIMAAWRVTDDIQILIDNFDSSTDDDALNILIGIHGLCEMRFNTLFNVFEQVIAAGGIGTNKFNLTGEYNADVSI